MFKLYTWIHEPLDIVLPRYVTFVGLPDPASPIVGTGAADNRPGLKRKQEEEAKARAEDEERRVAEQRFEQLQRKMREAEEK